MQRFGRIAGLALAASLAATSAHAGAWLNGAYYELGYGPGSVSNALADIAGKTPTATFEATKICFPTCGGVINDNNTEISAFLGGNATNLSSNQVTDLTGHVVVLTGALTIATTGSYTFLLGSDDGSKMWIDGSVALNDDGSHPYTTVSNTVSLAAGKHSVEIVQFEDYVYTGLTVEEDGSALRGSEICSAVPEPATCSVVMAGLGCLWRARRRRAMG